MLCPHASFSMNPYLKMTESIPCHGSSWRNMLKIVEPITTQHSNSPTSFDASYVFWGVKSVLLPFDSNEGSA